MTPILAIAIFFISVAILIRSGSIVVRHLSRIAYFFQISEFAASFVLIALATSLPELFIGISSAFHGEPELSFANVVGSNIAALMLAAGVTAVLARGLEVRRGIVRRGALYASFAAFFPVLLFLDGVISRVDGVVLILFASWYFVRLLFQREKFTKVFSNTDNNLFNLRHLLRDLLVLSIALVALVGSAEMLTRSALSVASGFGISLPIVGILFVALATSLPEIVFGARAVLMGHKGMVIGNLIGSVVVNSGFVLGITAIIAPIQVPSFNPYIIGIIFTAIIALMFALFAHTNKKISVVEGFLLIATYIVFILFLFAFGGNLT